MPDISNSLALWAEAQRLIPGGCQLLSRRPQLFALGESPIFASRAEGPWFWDVDGNRYLDTTMAVGAVLLGYLDPAVESAVDEQRRAGTIFSVIPPVEVDLARTLTRIIPCADMVRFGKSGGEANAVAVRIARAFTRRDRIAFCGYHGWHDWYMAANLNPDSPLDSHLLPDIGAPGIPQALRGTALPFTYNDIDSLASLLAAHPGEFAAIIMEASRTWLPNEGFLSSVQDLAHRHGALLIFDEVVTGFRLALGGAQQHYGVTPDLATFGKAIANGYPLTAIAGRRDLMEFSSGLFVSSTFWDDAASLAAGAATIARMEETGLAEVIAARGRRYIAEWRRLAQPLGEHARITGHPSCAAASFSSRELATLYIQEMARRGVFTGGGFNISLAHGDPEIAVVLAAAEAALHAVQRAIAQGSTQGLLSAAVQKPLFSRRLA
ncbi:MAG: aminotransferase class III-fold pyridoxal phosphate-dependent enzyme [Acidobacteria bacterium]|nr:aminotransferase class III-fold pyridoxal phosphate-dependent enzyme [Acidobacteriota bacterium]